MTFDQALRIAGLLPRAIVPDGKWRRCATEDKPRKRNGAYVLHLDGRGFFKNWATDEGMGSWRDDNATKAAPIDQEKLRAARERELRYRIQAVRGARQFWHKCRPLSLIHPYIDSKGLQPLGCVGLRTHDGLLVIPVMLGDSLISVQTIAADGTKRFWPGAPVKAGAYVLRRERAALTVICEGVATGLAIYQSVRSATVIVAFDAGNLQPVIERIRPTGSVVVAGDNDHGTLARRGVNPGVEKATNAADLIGAGVVWPTGIEGTDYADCVKEWGEGSMKRIERAILAKVKYVAPAMS